MRQAIWIGILALSGCVGTGKNVNYQFAFDEIPPENPILFMRRGMGDRPLSHLDELVFAIYKNCRVVRSNSEADIGASYDIGEIENAQIEAVTQRLVAVARSASRHPMVTVSAPLDYLYVRSNSGILVFVESLPHTSGSPSAVLSEMVRSYELANADHIDGRWPIPEEWFRDRLGRPITKGGGWP